MMSIFKALESEKARADLARMRQRMEDMEYLSGRAEACHCLGNTQALIATIGTEAAE